MTAFYDFFRFIKLYSTDGVTLEHTIEADAVTDTLSISRGAGVSWSPTDTATDSFKIDVNYNFEVPVATTTLRLTDVNSVDQDVQLIAGGNMTIVRNSANSLTIAALMGGVSKSISNATATDPVVITTTNAHDYTEGTPVTIVDVIGMTQLNGNEYYADVLTGNSMALYTDEFLATSVDGTGFTAYTSGGVVTGEYAGAKKLNDLVDVKFNTPNFTDSIKIGDITTGTLSAANNNVIVGIGAGNIITSAVDSVIIGKDAGDEITTGAENIVIGKDAGASGNWSTSIAIGKGAGINGSPSDTPYREVFIGGYAGTGKDHQGNVAVGYFAGSGLQDDSDYNVSIGYRTLEYSKGTGSASQKGNVSIGYQALQGQSNLSEGDYNVAIGYDAGKTISSGSNNVLIGLTAGDAIATGNNNIIIGDYAGTSALTDTVALYTGGGTQRLTIDSTGATINGDAVMLGGVVTSHLIPDTDATYDLGTSTHKFRDLHLDGNSFYLGGHKISIEANELAFGGAVISDLIRIAADDSTIRTVNSGESIRFSGAGSVTTASNAEGDITITGGYGGLTDNTDVAGVVAGDDGKILYYDHGTTSFKWKADDDTPAGYNNTDWDTAYGWGDHAGGSYLTGTGLLSSHTDVHTAAPTAGQVLMWDAGNSRWTPGSELLDSLTGSVFGDDSTLLVDGVNSTINLDGTMKTHIIPALDATYDIGSAEKKIRDLYVDGGGSIWVGGTTKMMIAPYDFQDATFSHYVSLTGNVIEPNGYKLESIAMSTDGTKIYIPQDEETGALPDYARIVQFTLSTPFDLSTITNTVAAGNSFDVSGEINSLGSGGAFGNAYIGGIHFKPDGTKMFMLTGNSIGSNPPGTGAHYHSATKLVEYDLGTPWDITTCAFNGKWSEGTGGGVGGAGYSLLYYLDGGQFKISNDGRFLYTGSTQYVKQFEMATPWDIKSFPWRDTPNGAGSHGNGPGWDEDNDFKIYTTKRWHDSQGLEKDSLIDIWVSDDGWRWFGLFSHGGSNDSIIYGYKMQIKYDIKSSLPFGADIIETVSNGYNPPFPDSIMISGSNHPNGSDGLQTGMPEAWGDYVQSIFFADTGKRLYVAGYTKNYPATDGIGGIQQYNITDSIEPQFKFKGTKGVKIEGEIELASGASVSEISTDTDMSDASDLSIPTELAVKTYVDTKISGTDLTIAEENSSLPTAATKLNFVGTGVTASGTGTTKTITIPGGGGGGAWTVKSSGTASAVATLAFTGLTTTKVTKIILSDMRGLETHLGIQASSNNGSSYDTGTNYSYSGMWTGNGSSFSPTAGDWDRIVVNSNNTSGATSQTYSEITINRSDSATYTTFMIDGVGWLDGSGYWATRYILGGTWKSTAVLDAIQIVSGQGNFTCDWVVLDLN